MKWFPFSEDAKICLSVVHSCVAVSGAAEGKLSLFVFKHNIFKE